MRIMPHSSFRYTSILPSELMFYLQQTLQVHLPGIWVSFNSSAHFYLQAEVFSGKMSNMCTAGSHRLRSYLLNPRASGFRCGEIS